jgi:uncharacterized membrane protein
LLHEKGNSKARVAKKIEQRKKDTRMGKGRLEAFSDGVMAIIITIMVLDLKVPHGDGWVELIKIWPILLSYTLSFVNIAIYWNNHHHMLMTVEKVDARILWTNMLLLFWLSLMPFTTGWMGENYFASVPVAVYSMVLLMCGISYLALQREIIRLHGKDSVLAQAVGRDWKGKASACTFVAAITLSLFDHSYIAGLLLICVTSVWFIPDRRIERKLTKE